MKRVRIFIFIFLLSTSGAMATPPAKLILSYDAKERVLNIDITHPSIDMSEHFIRRIVIYKNGEQFEQVFLNKQPHPYQYVYPVPLDLLPNDKISVKVYCREGGAKTAALDGEAAAIPPMTEKDY
ncbi:MAG: hypothetical protein NUV91_00770 [Candidatus Omnitrophica bacterium]|nr:hypothetical protein [Candidatus Omnitrophota bacterium]